MYDRILKISNNSCFIFGARGTGKTSWAKEKFPEALWFDLLQDDTYTELLARPSRLDEHIPDKFSGWIVVDEIQKVPALLNEIHRLIESRKLKFILTGSSARSLRRKGVNLLAGRALTYHMYPLTALELGNDFNIQTALKYGTLPAAVTHTDPEKYLSSYIATYLREEVLQEGLTRNFPLFTRFLETASFSQGEILNYTNIASEVASNRHVINQFFDILEDLLIAYRIHPFTKRAKREVVLSPKFYFFDTGIYRSIKPCGPLDTESESDGPALETLFLQETKAINDYLNLGYGIYYWRTRNQEEIDFILYGKRGLHAIEIKRKANLAKNDFKSLQLFAKDYPMAKCYLLYGGTQSYREGNIYVEPFATFIRQLHDYLK
ncbi:ATPase [Gammaproteobacteria bacterium SCGC AG-212-F23]|nr:ATPase [Gammaproteobacteria bacterium SCGC AG-212-F23]